MQYIQESLFCNIPCYLCLMLYILAFNVGEYRRAATTLTSHDFFRSDNSEAENVRK